jgi:hypothetical protein
LAETALRSLLAEFIVSIDPGGELAKGHERIDALKAASAALEAKLRDLTKAARPAAAAVSDVFAKAQASVGNFLGAQNAKAFSGRANDDGFAALGALRPGGPQLGPTREHFEANRKEAEAYANSLRGRLGAAFQSASRSADTFRGSGGRLLGLFTDLRAGLLAFGAGAAVRFAAGLVDDIGNLGEAASKLGVATDELQRLDVLAKQNATSVEAIGTAFRTLAKNAADPTKDSAAAFKRLGVTTKTADGQLKTRQDLFFETAGALSEVSNETQRAAMAQELFGRSGLELLPLLSQGRAGLEAQREALAKLPVVSQSAIEAADKLGDRWEVVKARLLARLAPLLENIVIPAFEKFLDLVETFSAGLEKFAKQTNFGGVALTGLALAAAALLPQLSLLVSLGGGWIRTLGGMAVAAGRAAISFARMALPFIFLEDVFTFFDGGDSLTGRLMAWIFGEDGGAGIQQAARDLLAALKELWDFVTGKGIGPALSQLGKDLSEATMFAGKDLAAAGFGGAITNPFGPSPAGPAQLGGGTDARTQNVTVNVGSTAEVAGAVAGATQGLGRDSAANLAAVGG